jgi:V/A-type H+/Na+-transporting ATPase subunit E
VGYRELIDALRGEGEDKVREIWREADEEARRIREEASAKAGELRERYREIQASSSEQKREGILTDARKEARKTRVFAEKELAERLYTVALHTLNRLRGERYKDTFRALVQELPHLQWETVRVNPADQETAREHFPDAEIIPDDSILGGFEVGGVEGRVRVINTFEKRLEKIWPEILPALLKDVYGMI